MTIVVVEGVDGAGKSTLIRNLRKVSRQYYWTLNASGPPNSPGEVERAIDEIDCLIDGSPTNWVFDRHPLISEPIYGGILRGKSHLEGMKPEIYKARLRSLSKIIYCRPPLAAVREEMRKEPQLRGVHDKIADLYDAYDEAIDHILAHLRIPVIFYDWTASPLTHQYGGYTCDLNALFWERFV